MFKKLMSKGVGSLALAVVGLVGTANLASMFWVANENMPKSLKNNR